MHNPPLTPTLILSGFSCIITTCFLPPPHPMCFQIRPLLPAEAPLRLTCFVLARADKKLQAAAECCYPGEARRKAREQEPQHIPRFFSPFSAILTLLPNAPDLVRRLHTIESDYRCLVPSPDQRNLKSKSETGMQS